MIRNLENDVDMFLEWAPLQIVENFTYLGSIQSNVGDIDTDVKCTIEKTCSVFRRPQTVWGSIVVSLTVKFDFIIQLIFQ